MLNGNAFEKSSEQNIRKAEENKNLNTFLTSPWTCSKQSKLIWKKLATTDKKSKKKFWRNDFNFARSKYYEWN